MGVTPIEDDHEEDEEKELGDPSGRPTTRSRSNVVNPHESEKNRTVLISIRLRPNIIKLIYADIPSLLIFV